MMIKNALPLKLVIGSTALVGMLALGSVASAVSMDDFGSATLQSGSSGAQVTNIQGTLNWPACGGYTTLLDGKFGPNTTSIVRAFQAAHGLTADGVVGPSTKMMLASCLNEQMALVIAQYR